MNMGISVFVTRKTIGASSIICGTIYAYNTQKKEKVLEFWMKQKSSCKIKSAYIPA